MLTKCLHLTIVTENNQFVVYQETAFVQKKVRGFKIGTSMITTINTGIVSEQLTYTTLIYIVVYIYSIFLQTTHYLRHNR